MSIYKRGKSFYYDFRFRKIRYRGSFGPVSKQTAETQERKLRVELAEGVFRPAPAPAVPTFREFCTRFLLWYEPQHRRESVRLANFSLWLACGSIGHLRLDAITPEVIACYQTELLSRGLAKSSTNTYLGPVRHLLRTAGQWQVIPMQAVPGMRMLTHPKATRRVLTREEEACLLQALPPRIQVVIRFALQTGLRYSELMRLRWIDLDFRKGTLRIDADVAKSHRAREVPLNDTARAILASVPIGGQEGRVFGYKSVRSSFIRARDKAGLDPAIKIHSCRHTFATRAIEAGVPVPTVQQWLGHASILMTAEYTHPSPEHAQQAIRLLDRMATDVPMVDRESRGST